MYLIDIASISAWKRAVSRCSSIALFHLLLWRICRETPSVVCVQSVCIGAFPISSADVIAVVKEVGSLEQFTSRASRTVVALHGVLLHPNSSYRFRSESSLLWISHNMQSGLHCGVNRQKYSLLTTYLLSHSRESKFQTLEAGRDFMTSCVFPHET